SKPYHPPTRPAFPLMHRSAGVKKCPGAQNRYSPELSRKAPMFLSSLGRLSRMPSVTSVTTTPPPPSASSWTTPSSGAQEKFVSTLTSRGRRARSASTSLPSITAAGWYLSSCAPPQHLVDLCAV